MPQAYFKNAVDGSTSGTFSGELTNSNGSREIEFENEEITNRDGSAVVSLDECKEYGCVDYSPGQSGKAVDMVINATVNITGTVAENDTKVAIRNLAKKISDGTDNVTVVIKKR